jgi:rhamnogalacturonyl hydrolase YesR
MNQKIALFFTMLTLVSCHQNTNTLSSLFEVKTCIADLTGQLDLLIDDAYKNNSIPRTVNENGETTFISDKFDWTEGFFPGTLWYAYNFNGDEKYKEAAEYFQNKFIDHRFLTFYHDLGFVFNNSFGAAYRNTKNEEYKRVMIDAGNSLIQRYNSTVGCIQSWDADRGWQAQRGWKFPVIIDNMMNLELLFELTKLTGDTTYYEIAVNHANTTMKNHFRDDYSSYHVVDYDPETGSVRRKQTAQGYSHESAWARGQAWGLYGFTMCYRYTKDKQYLDLAEKIARFYLTNKNLPDDLVPYWDFDAPKIPDEPRDVSAAAIVASALIELDGYSAEDFLSPAQSILRSLASDNYTAQIGTNNNFILKHSVGSIPHGNEIDVPLIYADYYYLEALIRLKNLIKT